MNREEAYLYDLFLTPGWRERYDRLVDQEFTFPEEGRFLDLEAGTGGFAVDLAVRGGRRVEVMVVSADTELQAIATEKARIANASNIRFCSERSELAVDDGSYDVAVADYSLRPWREPVLSLTETVQLLRPGGTLISKQLTQGSFDEFFSIFWEALSELGLVDYSPGLETLIVATPTLTSLEAEAAEAGLRHIRSVSSKEVFTFANATEFLTSPLIRLPFLPRWLEILPDAQTREAVLTCIAGIIDRERQEAEFDVSVRASLLIARRN